jgi:hypothetical protein
VNFSGLCRLGITGSNGCDLTDAQAKIICPSPARAGIPGDLHVPKTLERLADVRDR